VKASSLPNFDNPADITAARGLPFIFFPPSSVFIFYWLS